MKIVSAEIVPPKGFGDMAKVKATFEDGSVKDVVQYYSDELSFTAEEFVGLTAEEASQLFHKKDVAYLRS